MPKELDLNALVRKLRGLPPDSYWTSYVKLPVAQMIKLAQISSDRGVTLTVQLRDSLDDWLRAAERGVLTSFEPSLLDHLNLAATHLGLDREALVRQIVSEHLHGYLEKSLGKLSQRKELAAKIAKIAEATEAPKRAPKK